MTNSDTPDEGTLRPIDPSLPEASGRGLDTSSAQDEGNIPGRRTFTSMLTETAVVEAKELKGEGTMVIVDFTDKIPEDDATAAEQATSDRLRVGNRIQALVDPNTGKTWPGGITLDRIVIASKAETSSRNLPEELDKLSRDFPTVKMIIRYKEGDLDADKDELDYRKANKGPLLAATEEITIPKGVKEGVFTDAEQMGRSDKDARGLRVRDRQEVLNGVFQIKEIATHATNIQTGGPEEMIGRDHLMDEVKEKLRLVTEKKGTVLMPVVGDPGIGKSRLLVEYKKIAANIKGMRIVEAVANKHEIASSNSVVKRVVAELLKKNQGLRETGEYIALVGFLKRDEKYAGLFSNPVMLSSMMGALMIKNPETFHSVLLDDLQWCDDKSAIVIAELIRQMPDESSTLSSFTSRKGKEDMPKVIQDALEEKEAKSIEVKPLDFTTRGGRPTEVFRRYFEKSFKRTPDQPPIKLESLKEDFWKDIGEKVGGNPYALTSIIIQLERTGKLTIDDTGYIKVVGKINFDDFKTSEALYGNMINLCTPKEQDVLRGLKYFKGCNVKEEVFRRLFPDLDGALSDMIEESWVLESTNGRIKLKHDLVKEEVERRFSVKPELAWHLYEYLENNPDLMGMVAGDTKFELIKHCLKVSDSIKDPEFKAHLLKEARRQAVTAAHLYQASYSHSEVQETLESVLMRLDVDLDTFVQENPKDALDMFEMLANAYQSLSDPMSMLGNIDQALSILNSISRTGGDKDALQRLFAKERELMLRQCDAYYLALSNESVNKNKSQKMLSSLGEVIAELTAIKEGLEENAKTSSEDRIESNYLGYTIELNEARHTYQSGDKPGALHKCHTIITALKTEVLDFEGKGAVPLSSLESKDLRYAQLYVELERMLLKIVTELEEEKRENIDADVMYQAGPEEGSVKHLSEALKASSSLLKTYSGSTRRIATTQKDPIAAQVAHGRLAALVDDRVGAMKAVMEAARNASNFGERGLYGLAQKILADIMMCGADDEITGPIVIDGAVTAYRKGMDDLDERTNSEGQVTLERHPFYANLAASAARVIAIKAEKFGDDTTPEEIKRAWQFAIETYEMLAVSNPVVVGLYLVPVIGKLKSIGVGRGLTLKMPTRPSPVDPELVEAATAHLQGKLGPELAPRDGEMDRAVQAAAESVGTRAPSAESKKAARTKTFEDEIRWKLEGLSSVA